jgi:GTPase-associated system-like protein
MHKLYGWLRDAGIEANADTSPKHLKVIDEYVPNAQEIISFARLFYGFGAQDEGSMDTFGTALQEADPNFLPQKRRQEMSVFAGAALIALIARDQYNQLADLAALCLVCGGAQGVRTAVPVPDIPKIAARYIDDCTSKRASRPVGAVGAEDGSEIADLKRELMLVSEETNMLWWLVSEYSRDRNQSWKNVGALATPIVAGKELADLTRVIPGPVAAAAFLDRIVRLSESAKSPKPITIKLAVDKTPAEWREQYAFKPASHIEDLAPISNAIRLSLTVSDGDDWSPVFEKGTTLEAGSEMLPNALAYQVFLERLMVRLSGEVE